jgi:hypothetical protein
MRGLIHGNNGNQDKEMLTVRGAGLSAEVGELDGVEGSTTVPVLDGVEGSTTVAMLDGMKGSTTMAVLDRVEGMTCGIGSTLKSTTKSTMMLSKPSMCKLDI